MQVPVLVVIIDFKNDGCAFEIDRTKVVLAVGIIGGAKVVKGGDSIGQAANSFLAEGRDAGGQKTPPLYRCRRKSSLSARMRSVSDEDMVVSVLGMLGWWPAKARPMEGIWLERPGPWGPDRGVGLARLATQVLD